MMKIRRLLALLAVIAIGFVAITAVDSVVEAQDNCTRIYLPGGTLTFCRGEGFTDIVRCHARDGTVTRINTRESFFRAPDGPPWLQWSNNATACGIIQVWEIRTGERQWMFGPDEDGKTRVMINPFDACGYGWHEINGEKYNIRLLTDNAEQAQSCREQGRDIPWDYPGKDYDSMPASWSPTCNTVILDGGTLAECNERFGWTVRCHAHDGSVTSINNRESFFRAPSGPPWLQWSNNATACGIIQVWEISTGERQWMFGPDQDGKTRVMVNPFDACGYGWHEINGEKYNIRLLTDNAEQAQSCREQGRDIPWDYPGKDYDSMPASWSPTCNTVILDGGTLAECNERFSWTVRCHARDGSITQINTRESFFRAQPGPPWLQWSNNSTPCGTIQVWELNTGERQWMFGPDATGKTRIMVSPFNECGYGWHERNGEKFNVRLLTDNAEQAQSCRDQGRDIPWYYPGREAFYND